MSVFKGQCPHLLSVARLTFEKSKLPIIPFKGGVNMSRQAPPEVTNRHWVSIQDVIVANPPEPFFLKTKAAIFNHCCLSKKKLCLDSGDVTLNTNISPLRMAMVSKCPSQMLGPKLGLSGE